MNISGSTNYNVTISSQPAMQTCTVNNGTGTIGSANITNVQVVCSVNSYTVGGTISGLVGSVSLQNNGNDTLIRNMDGSFTFVTPVSQGAQYDVTVSSQPATQTCTVNNGTGTMGSANIMNVEVTCSTNSYTVGGTISGLAGSVSLQNNGGDTLTQSTNESFTFSTPVAQGAQYDVTVSTQPVDSNCTVSNGTGTMGGANVTNVSVSCVVTNFTTLGVSARGVIPVGVGSGSVTITNTGTTTAHNVLVVLPPGWTGVTQNASGCTSIAPAGMCTITFTTTKPYVAQGANGAQADKVGDLSCSVLH